MKIKALIAVRSGSVRVKNKNIRPFANSNLLAIKLEQLKNIPELDGVIVNSNDDGMLKIASKHGAETVKRDEYYSSNTVVMSDVYENMANNFNADIVVYTNVTNPLLKDESISKAIRVFLEENEDYDSVNTAHLVKEFMFLNNEPINYELKNQPRSQDLPNIYALNFAISVIERKNMIINKNVVGKSPNILGIDPYESLDIDNEIDFEIAEYLYRKQNAI